MSFRVEFEPCDPRAYPGQGAAVNLWVWKDDIEGDTDLLCTVRIVAYRDGVHIRVSDARGRPVAHLLDGRRLPLE